MFLDMRTLRAPRSGRGITNGAKGTGWKERCNTKKLTKAKEEEIKKCVKGDGKYLQDEILLSQVVQNPLR